VIAPMPIITLKATLPVDPIGQYFLMVSTPY
jgi:hypothetical protein